VTRNLALLTASVAALAGAGAAAGQIGAAATVVTYPSAQTIPATGKLPGGGGHALTLNEPIGGDGEGLAVVSGAQRIAVSVDAGKLAPLKTRLRFWHFVDFDSKLVPDALLPWDGGERATEQPNQPFSVEVSVPYGTAPGTYRGSVTVTADGRATVLPFAVTVYGVQLPKPGQTDGSLLTVFGVGPQAYVNRAIDLFHYTLSSQIRSANASLFAFLSAYRISPDSWGYGIPRNPAGYTSSAAWWKDAAGNMVSQLAQGPFSTLWIPVSNNRARPKNYVAGLSPYAPESWCDYLGRVSQFWSAHGWLQSGAIPYVFGYDEPGPAHTALIARQAQVTHRCFPGAEMLITANPSFGNARLYDGKGTDDVDIWSVVDWRWYGLFTAPARQRDGNRARMYERAIDRARAHGKRIFAYTYYGPPGIPSFRATEPLADPRMFVLWAALEGIDGILYGQGMTTYGSPGNPLSQVANGGESVLLYPGDGEPIPSARLEQIRSGIEDWEVFDAVRHRFGAARVRAILGRHGLFSADAAGVKLSCLVGCDIKGPTPDAWPRWSRDWTTAARIEAARLDALRLAAS
jgi:GNAT superfamily N-acetyltransferase